MATCATITGPTSHPIVDLDAGTTLPRAVSIGATVLVAAGIVATLLGGQPAEPSRAPAAMPAIAPPALAVPGWRLGWGDLPRAEGPAWPVGPSALIDASALAADVVIGR